MFDIIIGHSNSDVYRERNLKYTISYYLKRHNNANIVIVEQNTSTDLSQFKGMITHIKINTGTLYNRGLGFNTGVNYSKFKLFLLVDNDCILDPRIMDNLGCYIKKSKAFIPYNHCIDLNDDDTKTLINTNIIVGGKSRGGKNSCVGGAMFITKELFYYIKGYEELVGWGAEDECFHHKINLISKIDRVDGEYPMFHMYHQSAATNEYLNSDIYIKNIDILNKIKKMTKKDLIPLLK